MPENVLMSTPPSTLCLRAKDSNDEDEDDEDDEDDVDDGNAMSTRQRRRQWVRWCKSIHNRLTEVYNIDSTREVEKSADLQVLVSVFKH